MGFVLRHQIASQSGDFGVVLGVGIADDHADPLDALMHGGDGLVHWKVEGSLLEVGKHLKKGAPTGRTSAISLSLSGGRLKTRLASDGTWRTLGAHEFSLPIQ